MESLCCPFHHLLASPILPWHLTAFHWNRAGEATVRMLRAPKTTSVPWHALAAKEFQSILIDIIQGHRKYFISTGTSIRGGRLSDQNIRCDKESGGISGVLVDLDSLHPSDPLLLETIPDEWPSRGLIPEAPAPPRSLASHEEPQDPQRIRYRSELGCLLNVFYVRALTQDSHLGFSKNLEAFLWGEPDTFRPALSSMKDTWLRPLWRILGDSAFVAARPYPRAQADAILTYEKVIAIIERDVGSSELVFRAALRVPLPPAIPYELELIQKPTYQSLIHSVAPADFKRAVVDIAKTIIELRDVDLCFPAITPDRMLFQHQQLSAGRPCGFILDLDPLAMSSSLTDCAGQHHDPRALRLAAYDLAAAPHLPSSSGLAPRHALEALFNVLVWFCTYTRFDDEGRLTPVRGAPYSGIWLNPTGSALVSNRASHEYATFLQSRRAFMWAPGGGRKDVLLDGCGGKTEKAPMPDSMEALREDWVKPLWRMVSEAHFFARWREGEDGFDWATLGGQFTVERFMAVLSPEAT